MDEKKKMTTEDAGRTINQDTGSEEKKTETGSEKDSLQTKDADSKKAEEKTEEADSKNVEEKAENADSKKTEEKTEEADSKNAEEKAENVESKNAKEKTEEADSKNVKEKTEDTEAKKSEDKTEGSDSKNAEEKKTETEEKKTADEKKDSSKALTRSKLLAEAKEHQMPTNPSADRSKKKSKAPVVFVAVFLALLVIGYISGVVFFSGHFYPSVQVNGVDVSSLSKTEAQNKLLDFYSNYTLSIKTIDKDNIILNGNDISMEVVLKEDISNCLKKQMAYAWFINLFGQHEYSVKMDVTWNEEALSKLLSSYDITDKKSMEKPENAYIGTENGKFVIVPEKMGSTLDTDAFEEAVHTALETVQPTLDLVLTNCYDLPQIYADDETLTKDLETISGIAEGAITLQLDDLTLEPAMELYDKVLVKKGDSYEISRTKVDSYVKELSEQYNTIGKEREFTTSFQQKKVMISGTAFGYEINQEETADALYEALQKGKSATVEVVFNSKGYTLQGENDIGDTYIEVNLSEQHVVAYKNGKKLVEGDCVSGNESAGHGTCIGLYAIQDKKSPTVLRGEKITVEKTVTKKKKGKKVKVTEKTQEYEYESPVTYWMQFNGGIGLHDAAGWRSAYGGSIYYYSGSHGCVNLPLDLAKTLYENFEVGDPVVVYFWDNENRE